RNHNDTPISCPLSRTCYNRCLAIHVFNGVVHGRVIEIVVAKGRVNNVSPGTVCLLCSEQPIVFLNPVFSGHVLRNEQLKRGIVSPPGESIRQETSDHGEDFRSMIISAENIRSIANEIIRCLLIDSSIRQHVLKSNALCDSGEATVQDCNDDTFSCIPSSMHPIEPDHFKLYFRFSGDIIVILSGGKRPPPTRVCFYRRSNVFNLLNKWKTLNRSNGDRKSVV